MPPIDEPNQIVRLRQYEDARVPVYRNPSAETVLALLGRPLHEHEESIEVRGYIQGSALYVWDGFLCTHGQMWHQKLNDLAKSLRSEYKERDFAIWEQDGEIEIDCWPAHEKHPRLVALREELAACARTPSP